MPTYVAFLRAINLGKNRKVPMAELRACLGNAGFDDVETHIQTGNVKLRSTLRSPAKVEERLERVLVDRFGFAVPAIVFTPAEVSQVYDDATRSRPRDGDVRGDQQYVVLFKKADVPTDTDADAIAAWDEPGVAGLVQGRAVHVWIDKVSMDAAIFKAFKKQLDPGTNRNLRVIEAVADKWGA